MRLLPIITAAALSVGLAVSASAADKIAKIGVLAPMSGGAAADGEETLRGVKMAVEEVNAAGGIAGYKFEVVLGDVKDQTSDAVVSAFERLNGTKNLDVILTGYATQSNFEIEYMAEAGMVYMLAGNSNQTRAMVQKDPGKFSTIWSFSPSFDAYETELLPVVEGLAKAGKLKLANKKIAVVSSDNAYSKSIYAGIKKSFKSKGWNVTVDEIVPSGEINDWRALLTKVRNDPPAVIVNTDWMPSNAATFISQFMEKPTDSLVFIQYGPSVPEFLKLTKGKSTGVIYNLLGGSLMSPKNPRAAEVGKMYKDKYGKESGPYGTSLYEMAHIYFDAVRKVGDPANREAIAKAIGETDKQVSIGRLKFDPKTHLSLQGNDYVPIQFYQIWDGKRTLFYPTKYSTGDFKAPPWMN